MIAIVKMRMPDKCADCRFAHGEYGFGSFWCFAASMFAPIEEKEHRQEFCPLVEVAVIAPVLPEETLKRKFS